MFILVLLLPGRPGQAQMARRVVFAQASRVNLNDTGIHTHANFVLFDTGKWDVGAMQEQGQRYGRLQIVGHCRLSTDHAALPPDYQALAEDNSPIPNPYGPIDGQQSGKPGWGAVPLHRNGHNWIKILVPTRFANWVALQPKERRLRYANPRSYSLEVRWQAKQP